jgi:acetyl/propionyl-CoA carboxylase alpha subunit
MAREAGYDNVGTWEWIVSPTGQPFLMEVNTRIQVENGVSAAISSVHDREVDLIREQIRLGLGQKLGYSQKDVRFNGVGIEYRIIAEDPEDRFAPWVGKIEKFSWMEQPWLKVYTQVPSERVYEIPTEFDPNLALAIVWGKNLDEARNRGHSFLNDLKLEGRDENNRPLKSNIGFLKSRTDSLLEF